MPDVFKIINGVSVKIGYKDALNNSIHLPKKDFRTCCYCGARKKINCIEYCSLDCKREMIRKERTRPLDDFDFKILKKQKRDGFNRPQLKSEFNISDAFIENLIKRSDKHLTDTQLKNLYLD